jgi:hypothetical protein
MLVEQTTQLIQLILNALLMVLVCVIVLSGLMMRHRTVVDRLHQTQQEHSGLPVQDEPARQMRLGTKAQIRSLRRRYRLTHTSILVATYALLCCLLSAFSLVCRTLINWNSLVIFALALSVVGLGILLLSIGVTLLDIYTSHCSLKGELSWLLEGRQDQKQHQGQAANSMLVKSVIAKSKGRSKPSNRMFRKANVMIP